MSFMPISVREAVDNINANNNGWFLPATQRPYVWGGRYESEKHICKLFDSILRSYPVGLLITWNTSSKIAYREFPSNYINDMIVENVPVTQWERPDKHLVYDGQQRLQTLYSCLRYTINGRVLAYNLLFKPDPEDEEDNGFKFFNKDADIPTNFVAMNDLFSQTNEISYRKKRISLLSKELANEYNEILLEENLTSLWKVFVDKDKKSLALFPLDNSFAEDQVNEIFQRLNSGGVALSEVDLLLSKIKEKDPEYENKLKIISSKIDKLTNGYSFSASQIFQLIHLIVKNTTRVSSKANQLEINKFMELLPILERPLLDFFEFFIKGLFSISHKNIAYKTLAILPLIVYSYNRDIKGTRVKDIETNNIIEMKQYFILSQLNDWNTQTIVSRSAKDCLDTEQNFPLAKIKEYAKIGNRKTDIGIEEFENQIWFPLKVLLPNKTFILASSLRGGRYAPELDHIFPTNLDNRPENYSVNILWNMQPVTGVINAEKSNIHPKVFFQNHPDYMKNDYDFIPDLEDKAWENHNSFIEWRKEKMLEKLKELYNLELV